MGMPFVQTIAAGAPAGAQAPYSCDWMQSPFGVSWSMEGLGAVTGTYTIEQTMDDLNNSAITPVWTSILADLTANAQGNIGTPCTFVRARFTTGPVGGSVRFRCIQGMSSR